jgi:hypothetical protein
LAQRQRYQVKQQAPARDGGVKGDKGQHGFGVEVYRCLLVSSSPEHYGQQVRVFAIEMVSPQEYPIRTDY